MDPRLLAAILAGKLTTFFTRTFRQGGGTSAPGLVVENIYPGALGKLSRNLSQGIVLISGTNGKTTTSRLLSHIIRSTGVSPLHNRSGSNLTRGLLSTLLQHTNLRGDVDRDFAIFEVDEAALTQAAKQIKTRVLVLNNLFRDQLDRYFEIDRVLLSWRQVVTRLPETTILCLNADDPRVATLGRFSKGPVYYFGIKESREKLERLPQASDILACPDCQGQLSYDEAYLSHQGRYFCGNCTFKRPNLDISAHKINLQGLEKINFELNTPKGSLAVTLGVPGFYNVYNALAAATAGFALGVSLTAIQDGLGEFRAAFGRIERIPIGEKEVLLTLVKNPTGFNEVLRMLSGTEHEHLLLALNDLLADGRDVSWIWDVDLEKLANQKGIVTISGIRAWDLANRLKYAGVNPNLLQVQPDLELALKQAIDNTLPGKTLYILPTYTAMLDLRQILTKMGHVGDYWNE